MVPRYLIVSKFSLHDISVITNCMPYRHTDVYWRNHVPSLIYLSTLGGHNPFRVTRSKEYMTNLSLCTSLSHISLYLSLKHILHIID